MADQPAAPDSAWPDSHTTTSPTPAGEQPVLVDPEPEPLPPIPQRAAAGAAMIGTQAFASRPTTGFEPTSTPLPGPAGSRLPLSSPPTEVGKKSFPAALLSRVEILWSDLTNDSPTELLMTGLTALGGALVLISFFLPWSGANGIGIGTQATADGPAPAYSWAFTSPAGVPLFVLFLALGVLIVASDKLRELMPRFGHVIGRLTQVFVPIFLGAMMLAVSYLYLTLPWGCGQGPSILGLGAALFVASGLVALFQSSESTAETDSI